jgi:hypothetical protein
MAKRRLKFQATKPKDFELFLQSAGIAPIAQTDANIPAGTSWDVTIMKAGNIPANIMVYAGVEALRASIPAFEGAKVYSVKEGDRNGHKSDRNKKVPGEIVGVLSNVRVEGDELRAMMSILPSETWLRDNLMFLASKNQLQVYQLSVDSAIDASKRYVPEVGQTMLALNKIVKADLDIVGEAAGGGKFNRMVASKNSQSHEGVYPMKDKLLLLFTMLFPTFLASKGVDPVLVNENELFSHLLQAGKAFIPTSIPEGTELTDTNLDAVAKACRDGILQAAKPQTPAAPNSDGNAGNITQMIQAALDPKKLEQSMQAAVNPFKAQIDALQLQASRANVHAKLADSKLPEHARVTLEKQLQASVVDDAAIDAAIKSMRDLVAPFVQPQVNNRGMDIQAGADAMDKFQAALDGTFLTAGDGLSPLKPGTDDYKKLLAGQDPFRSIKEAYITFTGDTNVTGRPQKGTRFTASLATGDWANVLANSMNRRMVRDYSLLGLDTWRQFVDIVSLNDFREQQRVRVGGYGNIPIVGQRAPYAPLTSPADEVAKYTPSKRGGTEDVTLEMIKNDDVQSISKIPTRMARAAGQTLHEFVYAFVDPAVNAAIYDSTALYDASRLNTGTAALDATGLAAARLRMRKQKQAGSLKPIGIRAGLLLVPSDLEVTAYGLVTPAYDKNNNIPTFLQQIGITPVIVDYWTDVTNWALVARREDITGLEVGFMDGNETPEMFVSDMANVGSFFTNDVITYKLKHVYGGMITDYRAFDGSVVAG